ncbi:MAG TPA: DUF4230 domain-containing protein [Kiritimatiellia bacterium]|nr:DUF4230 domain-containing protein [Kiritimatiellia bacterium]
MISNLIAGILLIAAGIALGMLWMNRRGKKSAAEVTIYSTIQQLRSIGQLSVFKAVTKEIVTETDHSWGAFGKKYLSWVLSQKKMAMIFEFEIDFRYDLRRQEFQITETGPAEYKLTLPPCQYEVHIRDIRFYDEQGSRFMPWLVPDLLNGFLSGGFSEEDKNNLVRSAKSHAEKEARKLIDTLQAEVQASARAVLQSIGKAFGAQATTFEFMKEEQPDMNVAYPQKAA